MKNLSILSLLLFLFSCGSGSTDTGETTSEAAEAIEQPVVVESQAVCIWNEVSVRETPNSKGKWKTSMSVGEKITFLGETAVDSLAKNREYFKVRLADGTEGWSVSDFIVVDGTVAVFLTDKDIYKRPDLLTKSDKKFNQMDIVAIKSEQDDWLEVTGKRFEGKWIDTGWVKKGELSQESIDIAVAKFASIAMAKEDESEKIESLEEIIGNSDFTSSSFIPMIQKKLEELTSPEEVLEEVPLEVDSVGSDA